MSCCGKKPYCEYKDKGNPFKQKSLLTIGMPCFDDFDGVYFSTQAVLLYHREVLPYVKFLIVDNNPGSKYGEETRKYAAEIGATYVPFEEYQATAVKELVFEAAETPYVLCMDSHVLLESGAIAKLLMYYQCNEDTTDLLHGPLLAEDPTRQDAWTHMDPRWSGHMFGVWSHDPRGKDPNGEPFEIPMQGMGLFSCRKEAWPGFNRTFRGFGGEEWYIHEKFRKSGSRVLCLPFLRWQHRFRRPGGVPHKVTPQDKIRNYYIGNLELGNPVDTITNYFHHERGYSKEELEHLLFEAKCLQP